MVTKIPKNSLPTSSTGSQVNWFALRTSAGVKASESPAAARKITSRSTPCPVKCTPSTVNSMPLSHTPAIKTAPIITPKSAKLILPSTPNGSLVQVLSASKNSSFSLLNKTLSITKYSASKRPTAVSIGKIKCSAVQKKSTPRKKPKNSGGSPNGVSEPAMLATIKIKNTKVCIT